MDQAEPPIVRRHILNRLVRLSPENTDIESINRFVQERAAILHELGEVKTPWTQEDQDILEAAMRHAEQIMTDLEALYQQMARQIEGLQGSRTWSAQGLDVKATRISRRY